MMFPPLIPILLLLTFLGGCAIAPDQGMTASVVVYELPPPPKYSVPGLPPSDMHIWVNGRWKWRKNGWVWIPGYFTQRPYRNAVWIDGHWKQKRRGWVWVPGHWKQRNQHRY